MKKIKNKIIVTLLIAESVALLCIILCHLIDVSVSVEKRTKKDIHNDVILPANETATEKPLTEDNTYLYKYTVDANAVYIDGYLGNEKRAVIPSVIDGRPVTRIKSTAFMNENSLEYIKIPDSVTHIEENAFDGCSVLVDIEVGSNNKRYSSVDGVLFNKKRKALEKYPESKKGVSYKVPEGVETIKSRAFYNCKLLSDIEMADGVKNIESYAFAGCESLKDIKLSPDLTGIEEMAFCNCISLVSIKLPAGLADIEDYIFDSCKSLTDVSVDDSNNNFCSDDGVLYSKKKDILIYCPAGKNLSSYTVPKGVKRIKKGAFSGCILLKSIRLPEEISNIESGAFYWGGILQDIYYEGNSRQWKKINIGSEEEPETENMKIHYLKD